MSRPSEARRVLELLPPNDFARPLVELALEVDNPAITTVVVKRLLEEIANERGSPSLAAAAAQTDPERKQVATESD